MPVKRLSRVTPPTRIVESGAVCHPSGHAQEMKSFACGGAQRLSMTEIFSVSSKFRGTGFHCGRRLSEYPFQHPPMSLKYVLDDPAASNNGRSTASPTISSSALLVACILHLHVRCVCILIYRLTFATSTGYTLCLQLKIALNGALALWMSTLHFSFPQSESIVKTRPTLSKQTPKENLTLRSRNPAM